MPAPPSKPIITSPGQFCWDLLLIALGSILCAIAINAILIPRHFVNGGVAGFALLVHNQLPFLNVGLIYALLNIPLFALAWMSVGRRFFVYSILGSLALSLAIATIHVEISLQDNMLSALLAGIILGTGAGISLRSSGSQGGLDILSILLLRKYSISIGNTILAVNGIVLFLEGALYSLEAVLYTLVVIFVSSKVVNLVITGLSQRKAVLIISKQWLQIADEILKDIRRGVTVIEGRGGYSGKKEHILYAVVTFREIGQLKRLVQHLDPEAFIVMSDTLEVVNYRIGNQPHW
jgi:uncharacterized membrane-anchored protein YitT (DUF2179 family)